MKYLQYIKNMGKRENGMKVSSTNSVVSYSIKTHKIYESHCRSVPKAFRTVRFDFYVMRKFDRS